MFADTPQELPEISQERIHHHQRKVLARQVLSSLPSPVVDSMATIVELARTRTSLARVQAFRPDLPGLCPLPANAKAMVYSPSPSPTTVADMHKKDHGHQHWTTCGMVQIRPFLRRRKSTKVCGPEFDEIKSMMRTPTQTTSTLHHPLMLLSRFPTGDLVLHPLTPV